MAGFAYHLLGVLCVLATSCAASQRHARRPRPAPVPAIYVVQKGDTLYGIGRRHGLTVAQIMARNRLASHHLAVGARLRLQGAGAVAKAPAPAAQQARAPAAPARRAPRPAPPPAAPARVLAQKILSWPLRGAITSRYGRRGAHVHDGIDIGAPQGTQVAAAEAGEVVFAKRHGNYGNLVILQHRGGIMTIYAHHERNLVRPGQRVQRGEIIARVGATGRATGPHLHFEVRLGARPQDPLLYLRPPA